MTNDEGFYRFPTLPPGEYVLLATREGYATVRREGLHVGVGFALTLEVEMKVATREVVLVEHRSPILDRHATAIAVTFDAVQLANIPGSRSMQAILAMTPAVQLARTEVGGSSGAFGSPYSAYGTSGANRPMIEGINVAGIAPTGFALNYGSFEQVSVGTAAHSAEWPMPGVQMQFLSKSGGNQYRGTLYADYENNAWQSFNIDADQILRGAQSASGLAAREANRLWSYHDVNADVGGYIKPDTAWWYFLGQRAGRVCPAGESSGDTLSNTTDELQRQSHLSAHPTRQARGVRAGGSKPTAHSCRSLWASRRRSQRLDGHQRISRLDDQSSRLGLGMERRMELGRARQAVGRGSRGSVRRRPLGNAEWHGGPIRRHRDTRRAGWQSRLATRSPPQPGGRIAQLLQGRLVREPSREGRRRTAPD